jgi:hypothetical protein
VLSNILSVEPNELIIDGKINIHSNIKKVPIIGTSSCGKPTSDGNQETNRYVNYNGEYWNKNLYCVISLWG